MILASGLSPPTMQSSDDQLYVVLPKDAIRAICEMSALLQASQYVGKLTIFETWVFQWDRRPVVVQASGSDQASTTTDLERMAQCFC